MTIEIFFALVLFALASSITPGPNNLMLMTSGVNFGFKLSLPHMFGVSLGFNAIKGKEATSTPMTFMQAVIFQWVNPKAWSMALTAISVYAPTKSASSVVIVSVIFGFVNFPCIAAWTALGTKLKRLLNQAKRLRAFNMTMATLLVLSLYPIFI